MDIGIFKITSTYGLEVPPQKNTMAPEPTALSLAEVLGKLVEHTKDIYSEGKRTNILGESFKSDEDGSYFSNYQTSII